MQSIKEQFGLTHLREIYAFIDVIDNSRCGEDELDLQQVIDYADLIRYTKLTKEMFIGEKAIFEGFELDITDFCNPSVHNGFYELAFFEAQNLIKFGIDSIYLDFTDKPKTLADLATLTKDNPLKLK